MHDVLINGLVKLAQEQLHMTIAVYWGVKPQTRPKTKIDRQTYFDYIYSSSIFYIYLLILLCVFFLIYFTIFVAVVGGGDILLLLLLMMMLLLLLEKNKQDV